MALPVSFLDGRDFLLITLLECWEWIHKGHEGQAASIAFVSFVPLGGWCLRHSLLTF